MRYLKRYCLIMDLISMSNYTNGTGNGMGLDRYQLFYSIPELSVKLRCPEMTVWRLLKYLEGQGVLVMRGKRKDRHGEIKEGHFIDFTPILPDPAVTSGKAEKT